MWLWKWAPPLVFLFVLALILWRAKKAIEDYEE